ncbi:MAG: hypothetical protein ACRC5N_01220 [Plesiomonas sp.]
MASAALLKAMEPKSDQLNADDLIGGAITVTITAVKIVLNADQKVVVSYQGDNGKPYKPSKGMYRLMAQMWGADEALWIGKSLTHVRDPAVRFGADEVGGIRIHAASHIPGGLRYSVTMKKGVRKTVQPERLGDAPVKPKSEGQPPDESSILRLIAAIEGANDPERLNSIWTHAATRKIRDWLLSNDTERCDSLDEAYNSKLNSLEENSHPNTHPDENYAADERALYQGKVDEWLSRLGSDDLFAPEIKVIETAFLKDRAALPDDIVEAVEVAIAGARKRVGGAA